MSDATNDLLRALQIFGACLLVELKKLEKSEIQFETSKIFLEQVSQEIRKRQHQIKQSPQLTDNDIDRALILCRELIKAHNQNLDDNSPLNFTIH